MKIENLNTNFYSSFINRNGAALLVGGTSISIALLYAKDFPSAQNINKAIKNGWNDMRNSICSGWKYISNLSTSKSSEAEDSKLDAWEVELNDWVNNAFGIETTERAIAKTRIETCIRENGSELNLSNLFLSSLPPVLHHCKALRSLDCSKNRLTTLNLDGCHSLTKLDCSGNLRMDSLKLDGFNSLQELNCSSNQLTELNLDGCSNLQNLSCYANQLTTLKLNGYSNLQSLSCSDNQLTALNLDGCSNLQNLSCPGNKLTALNIAGCSSLKDLYCSYNQLDALNLNDCSRLEALRCFNNQLTALNLDGCSNLKELSCSDNQLTSMNIDSCSNLQAISCFNNQLASLNLNGFDNLKELHCSNNQLTSLELNDCSSLVEIYSNDNSLTSLNLESCKRTLETLDCSNNELNSLNLGGYSALQQLGCSGNQLVSLHLNDCRALQELYFSNNPRLEEFNLQNLLQMDHLTNLFLEDTGIDWNQLPREIQDNQNIHIDIRPELLRDQRLNAAQSTHTASIHQEATKTAARLKKNNSEKDLELAYSEFLHWLNQQPVSGATVSEGIANQAFKIETAQSWVRSPFHANHQDYGSGVTVKEFLALAWLAIKDSEQREAHLSEEEALDILVDALYEIRRGYNLSEGQKPKDDGQPAINICAGGTFNKIYEKLTSVIKGVDFVMITPKTLQMKMNVIIKEEVRKLCDQDSRNGEQTTEKELEISEYHLTDTIWNKIKNSVVESIHNEFFLENSKIGGKTLNQHLSEFESSLEYLQLKPTSSSAQ